MPILQAAWLSAGMSTATFLVLLVVAFGLRRHLQFRRRGRGG